MDNIMLIYFALFVWCHKSCL